MLTIDNLYALSSLFGVSMDDIVRGNKSDIKITVIEDFLDIIIF